MSRHKSITTKTGDQGTSRLFSGESVLKASGRLDAYGDLDELTSILGIARHQVTQKEIKGHILFIQKSLSRVAAELATTEQKLLSLKERVDETFLNDLEKRREYLETKVPFPSGFIIPANTLAAAHLDHARTVARRCERKAVTLFDQKQITNKTVLVWLNRLSDFLYLMARFEEGTPLYVKESQ